MLRSLRFLLLCAAALLSAAPGLAQPVVTTIAEDIEWIPLSPSVFIHRTYTQTESFGRVGSNGLVYVVGSSCYVFDTPMRPDHTETLLSYLEDSLGLRVEGLIVNHFHDDCLGGIEAFHRRGLPSYAGARTQALARARDLPLPQHTFRRHLRLDLGGQTIECYYPGAAHTRDNIVCWLPGERVLFGGCMVKAVGAGRGNLADADVTAWSHTVRRVKQRYPDATLVVPGHGAHGGTELLDFTIDMFQGEAR
ncbi:MAG: BcII family subclass B1 metallo-beta-lactamase [Bacteroidia bacterium]